MKRTLLLFVLIIIALFCEAQLPPLKWTKGMGVGSEMAGSMAVDANGNTYAVGYFTGTTDFDPGPGTFNLTSNGAEDIFILKLDALGNFTWAKSVGGSMSDGASSISLDALGNIYISGAYRDIVDFDPGPGTYTVNWWGSSDCFILKLDASGNFLWAFGFGDGATDVASSTAIDGAGNVLIAGYFAGTIDFDPGVGVTSVTSTSNNVNSFILKLDGSGNFLMVKTFGGNNMARIGNMTLDAAGNIYTTGNFFGNSDFDPGPGTYTLMVFGSNSNAFVTKFDPAGSFLWAVSFQGGGFDYGYSIKVDASGNVYSTGGFGSSTDFDPGPGSCTYTTGSGNSTYISKLDASGNFVWAKSLNNYGPGVTLRLDATNKLYIGGTFNGSCDFDPGPGTMTISSLGNSDAYILNLDASGNFISVSVIGGSGAESIKEIQLNTQGEVFCFGIHGVGTDFDPGPGTYTINATAGLYLSKFSSDPSLVKKIDGPSNVQVIIYPNPVSDKLFIQQEMIDKITIENCLGETVYVLNNPLQKQEIDLSNFPYGIYFLKAEGKSISKDFKILKL